MSSNIEEYGSTFHQLSEWSASEQRKMEHHLKGYYIVPEFTVIFGDVCDILYGMQRAVRESLPLPELLIWAQPV